VVERLRARGLVARATVQSFDPGTLRRVRTLEPSLRTMLLVSRRSLAASGLTGAAGVGRATEIGATDLGIDHRAVDGAVVAAARAAGLRLSVWTVNEEPDLLRVRALGAAVVMTDRPDLARRLYGGP
jgi:glycerophosphoryl diester phosphodiesterase